MIPLLHLTTMFSSALALFIVVALVALFLMNLLADSMNLRALSPVLPDEFRDVYDAESYARSQRYTRATTYFAWIEGAFELAILLLFWALGGFDAWDSVARNMGQGPIVTGLVFIGGLALASDLLAQPFALYSTFVIEQRFGFNRTDAKTFVLDWMKQLMLSLVLGSIVLSGILAFFEWAGGLAWLYAWVGVTALSLLLSFVAPTWILPLFNEFTPLEEGELRRSIFEYAARVDYPLTNIFVIDGSKRSTKSNAFFTGFGRNKRIALYDTLVENHSVDELVGVMAHEIGHYKRAHVKKGMLISVLHFGVLFFLLSLIIDSPALFEAFGMEHSSVHAGLVFFMLLYAPVSAFLGPAMHWLSRKHEFEADRYAVETTGRAEPLISALKTLSLTNLGNLTPHPIYVGLNYSHPPLLERIAGLRRAHAELD